MIPIMSKSTLCCRQQRVQGCFTLTRCCPSSRIEVVLLPTMCLDKVVSPGCK